MGQGINITSALLRDYIMQHKIYVRHAKVIKKIANKAEYVTYRFLFGVYAQDVLVHTGC